MNKCENCKFAQVVLKLKRKTKYPNKYCKCTLFGEVLKIEVCQFFKAKDREA